MLVLRYTNCKCVYSLDKLTNCKINHSLTLWCTHTRGT